MSLQNPTEPSLPNGQALADEHLGLEARSQEGDHLDLRIWLRLLACSTQIEQVIRQQLRVRFASTLPRFDYLAQLERHPNGLRMNVLSRYLMVTGGNVTGLTDQLVRDGLVERVDDPDDRRSYLVRLTPAGRDRLCRHGAGTRAVAGVAVRWPGCWPERHPVCPAGRVASAIGAQPRLDGPTCCTSLKESHA
jgi:DNA-binding MarR family transcriptional regulator